MGGGRCGGNDNWLRGQRGGEGRGGGRGEWREEGMLTVSVVMYIIKITYTSKDNLL